MIVVASLRYLVNIVTAHKSLDYAEIELLKKYGTEAAELLEWKPISSAPRDGTFVELRGDSGYKKYPYRIFIGHYNSDYEAPIRANGSNGDEWAWRTVQGGHVTDDGAFPTHWRPVS